MHNVVAFLHKYAYNGVVAIKREAEMKTVVEVGEDGEVLSSIEVPEGEEISINRKRSAWEEVVKVYGWNNPTILRTEELYNVVREKAEVLQTLLLLLRHMEPRTNAVIRKGGIAKKRLEFEDLQKESGQSRNTIWAHLRFLKGKGLIKRGNLPGYGSFWFLNPKFFVKGNRVYSAVYDMFKEENESGAGREE